MACRHFGAKPWHKQMSYSRSDRPFGEIDIETKFILMMMTSLNENISLKIQLKSDTLLSYIREYDFEIFDWHGLTWISVLINNCIPYKV